MGRRANRQSIDPRQGFLWFVPAKLVERRLFWPALIFSFGLALVALWGSYGHLPLTLTVMAAVAAVSTAVLFGYLALVQLYLGFVELGVLPKEHMLWLGKVLPPRLYCKVKAQVLAWPVVGLERPPRAPGAA